jgi:lipopolysaccharide assembly protein A
MRWLHLAVIVLFAAATIIFALQNFQGVTLSFFSLRLQMPLAMLIIVFYLLGTVSGSSLLAVLRRSLKRARRQPA